MPLPIKNAIAICAIALAVAAATQSPAVAEVVPEACSSGIAFVRNGIPYAHKCVTREYGYGRNRCTRWMPVMCGGGGTGNR
jgi:hypothetical protein